MRQTLAALRAATASPALRAATSSPALRAVQAARAGRADEAITLATAALEAQPDDADALALLLVRGQALALARRYDDALADLDRAARLAARLGRADETEQARELRSAVAHRQALHQLVDTPLDALLALDAPAPHRLMQLAMRLGAQLEARDLPGAAATFAAAEPLLADVDDPAARMALWVPAIQLHAARGDRAAALALLADAEAIAHEVAAARPVLEQLRRLIAGD